MTIPCGRCGLDVDNGGWLDHALNCPKGPLWSDRLPNERRDADLARKVKAGDLPGKVPEHYASMWDRRRYGTSL